MRGQRPHRQGDDLTPEDQAWEEVIDYMFWAVKHNWPPEVVDQLPQAVRDRGHDYHQMLDEIHQEDKARQDRIAAVQSGGMR